MSQRLAAVEMSFRRSRRCARISQSKSVRSAILSTRVSKRQSTQRVVSIGSTSASVEVPQTANCTAHRRVHSDEKPAKGSVCKAGKRANRLLTTMDSAADKCILDSRAGSLAHPRCFRKEVALQAAYASQECCNSDCDVVLARWPANGPNPAGIGRFVRKSLNFQQHHGRSR